MDTFYIRPACPGADIRDPETGDRLPPAGDSKPRSPHWLALQIRGDVVEGEPDEASIPAEPPSPPSVEPPPRPPRADKPSA